MKTRRYVLGLLGASLPAWSATSLSRSALSALIAVDDPDIKVTENLWILMSDGARLAARLFFPASADTRPVGAVLEYLPYRKRDSYRYRDDVAGAFLAKAGIALLRVDIRGTGDSDGAMADEYSHQEQADALAVLEWISRQQWCNGKVGMRGISYGAFAALQAAAKAPPALIAIVSTCGTEQRYLDDIHYKGGCLINDQFVWAMEWQVIMRAPPDPRIVGTAKWRALWRQRLEATAPMTILWNEHQTLDDKWSAGSTQDYSGIRCAIYNVGGMLDPYIPSVTRMMERAPQVEQKALIGPWTHKWPGYPQPAGHSGKPTDAANGLPGPGVDWLPVEARWWRHWLLGEANGIMEEPRFWAFREDKPAGVSFPHDVEGAWISEPSWPSAAIPHQKLFLNGAGLDSVAGEQVLLRHATDLTIGFANRWAATSGDPTTWWRDQSADDARCLRFDSQPLTAALDVVGEPLFTIRVRASTSVAKLCVRLTEVSPDGRSNFVSYGLLNLTHRNSDAEPAALVPDTDYDVQIKAHFCCYRFAPGSRIRVAVSETWWPVVWPSPEPVVLQVTAGVSHVELPVRPARAGETPPFEIYRERYAGAAAAPAPYTEPLAGVQITGASGHRTFTLIEGTLDPQGEEIPGVGTVYREASRLRRSIREDDPNSAQMEAEAINTYERGEWRIKLRAHSLCSSTPTHFLCSETFEAWEGSRAVYARTWEKKIPRRLL